MILLVAIGPILYGQVSPNSGITLRPHRLDGPIVFDGMPDDEEWQSVQPLEHRVYQPIWDGEHSEKTDILMAYDDTYLYLAGRMFVSKPSFIMDTGRQRDTFKANIDYFGLILDTFNDNENALAFFTTPAGLRLDFTVFNDASGDFPVNSTWNTFWDAKTVKRDDGWFAELRVPWSSLRFQDDDGKVTMGMLTWRWMPAKKRDTHVSPYQK